MNLVFDFGNTTQKMAAMLSGEVVDMVKKTKIEIKDIERFLEKYNPEQAILSSVVNERAEVADFLEKRIFLLKFSHKTPIPIQNEYKTPISLGTDRLACAVAAASLFPKTAVLVLQMGTCITSDFITEAGVYKGGSISPGLEMRLNALHHFSAKLPLVSCNTSDKGACPLVKTVEQAVRLRSLPEKQRRLSGLVLSGAEVAEVSLPFGEGWGGVQKNFIGTTTEESILTGIIYGIADETNGLIARYRNAFPALKIILTGGDAKLFENKIKNAIFVNDHLVLVGLNIILNYNVENQKNK